jgi:hypothetical protein
VSLTQLHTRKCRACGHLQPPTEGDECHGCGEHDKWRFFCGEHGGMFDTPVCTVCEKAAMQRADEARASREAEERRRREEEARQARRREYEREQQRKREEQARLAEAFTRVARIPAFIALIMTLLCFGLSVQLFTHRSFVIPYSVPFFLFSLGAAIVSALSILVIAVFWE